MPIRIPDHLPVKGARPDFLPGLVEGFEIFLGCALGFMVGDAHQREVDLKGRRADETGELDTVLRLYNVNEQLLAENDDAEDGAEPPNSAFTEVEIPAGFTVVIEAGVFEDVGTDGSSYTLTVEEAG